MATILVVDDHAVGRQVLHTLLGYMGHRVLEAAEGAQALQAAREGHPDMIISDIFMPNMDGVEFVRRLRSEPALEKIPVIFYTATYRIPDAVKMGHDVGVTRVIPKPSDPEVILKAVDEVLGPSLAGRMPEREGHGATELKHLAFQNFGLQLASVFDFSFHMAVQSGPSQMLDTFCRAINNLLKCRNALVALKESERLIYFPRQERPEGGTQAGPCTAEALPVAEILGRAEIESRPFRMGRVPGTRPNGTPVCIFESVLVVPFATPNHFYGSVCLTDKLDGSSFSDADEEIASSISTQAALAYEDSLLIEELRRQKEELEAANKEIEGFAYSISHDLRAPVRIMSSFARILHEKLGPTLDEESLQYLKFIMANGKSMTDMIDALLDFSRLGRLEMRMEDVRLGKSLKNAMESLDIKASGRRIEWKIGPLPTACGEPTLLQQVFQNLISNAINFTKPRSRAVIEVGCTEGENEYTVYVRDNGVGFNMEYKDKLFRVFQQLHSKKEFGGEGIGLANVQRIISRHGGRVWAESVLDQGATFYFTLPKQCA